MTFWKTDNRLASLPSDFGASRRRRVSAMQADDIEPEAVDQLSDINFRKPALCVARSDALDAACAWLSAQGMVCDRTDDMAGALQDAQADWRRWSMLLLAADDVGGITEVIDNLLMLRRKVPGLPVLLFTSQVRSDDFSTERLMLCDVTVRLPSPPAHFRAALIEATKNNRLWLDRHADLWMYGSNQSILNSSQSHVV